MVATSQLLIQIRADASSAMATVKGLEANFKDFKHASEAALPASLALAAAGAAIVAGFGGAVATAAHFDTAMTAIRNNTTMTNADADLMRQTVLKLGAEAPVPLEMLGQGFMHITNFGFSAKDAVLVLDAAMKSAVSTGGDTAATAEVLAAAMHEFGIPAEKAAETMDMLHTAAAEGNMTLEQFSSNFGQVAAWAAAVGVPLDQAAAAMSAMTRHGFSAAEAATQVKDQIAHLINPSSQAKAALQSLGDSIGTNLSGVMSPTELHAKGLVGVLDELHAAMVQAGMSADQQAQEWLKLLPNIRGGAASFVLAGRGAEDFALILHDMHATLGVTDDAFDRMKNTAGFQWGVLTNKMTELAMAIGSVLMPPLIRLVDFASMLVGAFLKIPAPIQTIIAYAGILVGAFLLTVGTLGILAAATGPLVIGFGALSALFSGVALTAISAAVTTAAAWVAAAWPILAIVGVVALVATAWANDWGNIREVVASAIQFIGDHIGLVASILFPFLALPGLIKEAWDRDFGGLRTTFGGVIDFIADKLSILAPIVQWVADQVARLRGGAEGVGTAISKVAAAPGNILGPMIPGATAKDDYKSEQATNDAAEGELKRLTAEADQRKNEFAQSQVDAETNVLNLKLQSMVADHETLALKQQMEDLDRDAVDYTLKRLQLDEQDAITKAKMAESSLKNHSDDLDYQQKLLMADAKAARARGETVDMHAIRQQIKDMKKEQVQLAPSLLRAEHGVALAGRAKDATDMTASLATTDLDRRKLALEEQLAPKIAESVLNKRLLEEAQYQVDLAKQKFAIEQQAYALELLRADAATKKAGLDLWIKEHPNGTTAAATAPASTPTSLPDTRYHPGEQGTRSTVDVGTVQITVQGGDTSQDTLQGIKDAIGSWFQQAVDHANAMDMAGPVTRRLGGAYGT